MRGHSPRPRRTGAARSPRHHGSAVWEAAYAVPMLELLRQRRWLGFTVFALAMLVLCLLLARWQWHRYEVRQLENARIDAVLSAPVAPLGEVIAATPARGDPIPLDPALPWRLVTATGTFDTAAEVAVRRRPLEGKNGFWIVTPLVTDTGAVLVNRGWAPSGADAAAIPQVPPAPSGTVTVTGRLRAAEPTPQTDAPPAGQAWAVDPQVLLSSVSAPRYDAYVELRQATPTATAGLVALTEDPGHRGWNNLIYSVQWVLFALVGAFGWWRLLRQEHALQERGAAAAAAPEREQIEPARPEQ